MTIADSSTVSDLIHALMDDLTSAERKVGRALLADYPAAGLGSAQALAAAANVSAPSVVRLATHLGFAGFTDMQTRLRAEVSQRASSPVLRTMAHGSAPAPPTRFHEAMARRAQMIEHTQTLVPHAEFDAVVRMLAECSKRVLIVGGFFSSYVAQIFAVQLAQVRSNVMFVAEPLRRDVATMLDAKRGSVLVIFDLRRYEHDAVILARRARKAGISVVLVTDRWLSPAEEFADAVLPVEVEATPFDSFTALLSVVEVIVEAVMHSATSGAIRRMQRWEDAAVAHTRSVDD